MHESRCCCLCIAPFNIGGQCKISLYVRKRHWMGGHVDVCWGGTQVHFQWFCSNIETSDFYSRNDCWLLRRSLPKLCHILALRE